MGRVSFAFALLLPMILVAGAADAPPPPKKLFDFETAGDLAAWSSLALPGAKEPPIRLQRDSANATSGKHSLKLTFAGGLWPTATTTRVLDDWTAYQTFRADVTVKRPCVVGFT